MPELPEMETYKNLLNEKIAGQVIQDVIINREKSVNLKPEQYQQELIGQKVNKVERRAKFLIFQLSSGKSLQLHLMLGGLMYLGNDLDNPRRTKQVILSFPHHKLYFIGLRLGYLDLLSEPALQEEFSDLGPEPLEENFTYEVFVSLLEKKRGMLKATLLNQKFIAGIGNCYSDEICYDAKLQPMKKIDELSEGDIKDLYSSLQGVLKKAIELGGYMEMPLYKGDTKTGGYNHRCQVYDREGEKCHRCGNVIIKMEISSRKTFYCPGCQKA
jgi:formamidopyrimidine-DNA glycosylase